MSTYSRVVKVPLWITVSKSLTPSQKTVVGIWALEAGAFAQDWPAPTFKDTLYSFRSRGYSAQIPESKPYVLDSSLLLRAASEHLKKTVSTNSILGGSVSTPINQLDRRVISESDLEVIFNDLMSLEDPIALSQIFQINERCHNDLRFGKNYKAFFSSVNTPKPLALRVADQVVVVGEDIEIDEEDEKTEIFEKLETFFV